MKGKKNTFLEKPLPRFFGLFILLTSIGVIFWLSRNVVIFNTRAALGNAPKDIQITNITADSFTVSYLTDEPVNGTLSYGPDATMQQVAFDTRDREGINPHSIHSITVSDLEPNTKYSFAITSGDGTFQNNESPFEITTAQASADQDDSPNQGLTITGQVIIDDDSSGEALVYISSIETQTISTLVSGDGSFEINIDNILNKDLTGIAEIGPNTSFEIRATNGNLSSTASFLIDQADPLPPITLSQDYDFAGGFKAATTASESAETTPFPVPSDAVDSVPAILTPNADETFNDQQPLFRGRAAPESDVEILIESSHQITATIQADENGLWEFRPDTPLAPGEHTITVTASANDGLLETLSRPFTVFAQGSQFVEPSISPTPTTEPTATEAPSPTPTVSEPTTTPTTAPTANPTPTATTAPTIEPTVSPTAIIILPTTEATTPSPTSQITVPPVPDVGGSALIAGMVGIIMAIGIGGLLFLLL